MARFFPNRIGRLTPPPRPERFDNDLSPLWKRFNLVCTAFSLDLTQLSEVTGVAPRTLSLFRHGHCVATTEELERIRIFVAEVERLGSLTLRHFKQEFSPLAVS